MHEHAINLFIHFVQDHRFWGYTILFFAMVFEGEVFLIVAGMLATIKAFDIGDTWWIAFIAVVLGNIMWYSIGAKLKDIGFAKRMIKSAEKAITFFLPRFREKPFKSIFFSKFIYGANRATVIMSGVFHVPFELFFRAEFLASILWVTLYESIGFFFGTVAIGATRNITRLALFATTFVIVFILIQKLIVSHYEQRERQKLENNEKDSRNA